MKKTLLTKTLLLLFALIAGSSSSWADTETFAYGDYKGKGTTSTGSEYTMVKTDVSITNTKFYGNNSYAHFYANGTTTITPASGVTITKIVLTASSTGYNGYQSSGTITASAGNVSGSTSSTTVTWTGSASEEFTISNNKQIRWTSIVVTYTKSGGTPTCAMPSFSPAEGTYFATQSVTISTETEGATIYYTTDGTAPTTSSSVYSSAISVSKTTTIKAIATKDDYNDSPAASATFTIFTIEDGVFDFVTAGGHVDYGSGVPMSTGDYVTENKTWTAGNVTMVTSGKYRWWDADNTLRFYSNTPNSAMTFSVPDGYVITKIVLTGGQAFEAEGYSSGTWKGAQQTVTLSYTASSGSANVKTVTVYYSTPTINVTMGEAGYMTYCNQNAAISFGEIEAYVVSAVGADNVTLTPITKAPANTAVILKGSAGEHALTIEESAEAVGTNKLQVSYGTKTSTDTKIVYALAKKNDVVGFYKVQKGVNVPAGKCFIQVEASTSAPDFLGFGGDATGIDEVRGKTEEVRGEFYNLAGQRVAQPTKGLYIVNGKKVVMK